MSELLELFRGQAHHLVAAFGRTRTLYAWVEGIRARWRAGELPPKLQRRLEAVHFPFDDKGLSWERTFAQAVKVARRQRKLPPEHTPLGLWVRNQLTLVELGEVDRARAERLEELAKIGQRRRAEGQRSNYPAGDRSRGARLRSTGG